MKPLNYYERLGMKLRTLRMRRGVTLDELADAIGGSPSNLSRWETGERKPNLLALRKIARALGTRVCDLLPNEDIK